MIDVDGVVVGGRPSDGRPWATDLETDLGLSFEIVRDGFFRPYWEEVVIGQADLRERLASVLAKAAPKITVEQVLAYWFQQDARLNVELLKDLAMLRSGGLQTYLATNQEHERAHYLMNRLGLAAHVDSCHYSAALRHRKPRLEFFQAVASKVGLPPETLLLVDDSCKNVQAAIDAGWHAVRWTGDDRLIDHSSLLWLMTRCHRPPDERNSAPKSRLAKGDEPHVGAGKTIYNFGKTPFVYQGGSTCRLKPLCFPLLLLRPIVALVFNPEQKNADLAENGFFGQPFLVMVDTQRPLADYVTDQASFFVCLSARYLSWCPPFHWPTLWDNPAARLAGGQ